jgi:hypothetical protein
MPINTQGAAIKTMKVIKVCLPLLHRFSISQNKMARSGLLNQRLVGWLVPTEPPINPGQSLLSCNSVSMFLPKAFALGGCVPFLEAITFASRRT